MFSPRFIGARNFLRRFDFYKFNALEKKLLIGGRQGESNDISVLIPVEFHESLIEEILVHIDRFYPHIAVSPILKNCPVRLPARLTDNGKQSRTIKQPDLKK